MKVSSTSSCLTMIVTPPALTGGCPTLSHRRSIFNTSSRPPLIIGGSTRSSVMNSTGSSTCPEGRCCTSRERSWTRSAVSTTPGGNAAGLTEHPFMDVISPALKCRDEDEKGITSADHRKHLLWRHVYRGSLPLYAEFREHPIPVLVPRRDDHGERDKLWEFVKGKVWPTYDGYQVVEGHHVSGPFNRSEAINTAARIAGNWDVAVIADGDAWVPKEQLDAAVKMARETGRLVSAFTEVWMLPEATTHGLLRG